MALSTRSGRSRSLKAAVQRSSSAARFCVGWTVLHSIMQAHRQIWVSPDVREAGDRERSRAEQRLLRRLTGCDTECPVVSLRFTTTACHEKLPIFFVNFTLRPFI